MSAIGGFSFLRMDGEPLSALRAAVEPINRPGVDGIATRTPADKSPGVQKQTIEPYTLLANANTAKAAYEALQGSYVTVTDDMGAVTANVLVVRVSGVRVQAVFSSADPTINFLVYATWELLESV